MGRWIVKTLVQRGFSLLPRSDWWNELLQRYVTHGLRLEPEGEFRGKLLASRTHFDYFSQTAARQKTGFDAMELGTGWFPIIPMGLYLCGAQTVWTYDVVRLLRADTFRRTLECFRVFQRTGKLFEILPAAVPERVERLTDLLERNPRTPPETLLKELNIHAFVRDVRKADQAQGSVDFVFSNGVLEHLSPSHLADVMGKFRVMLRPDGVMCHHVGLADQFASFDRSITPYNFLQYSPKRWRWLDNPIIPQNRLRHSDYVSIMERAGFEVVKEEAIPGRVEDLRRVHLAREFRSYRESDLLILNSWLIARPHVSEANRMNRSENLLSF